MSDSPLKPMGPAEKARILKQYDERLDAHGYDPKTLGWDKGRHPLRFEVLLSQWDISGTRVLDFGCGFGDLYGHTRAAGIDFDYLGIDLNPRLSEEARRQYPEARFEARDVSTDGLEGTFDYIFSSGVHNTPMDDNQAFTEGTFELFARHAKRGFAVNFLSDQVDRKLEDAHHTHPAATLDLAYRHSRRVLLRNDYMPFEFTVFVDLDDTFDPTWVVFPDHLGPLGANDEGREHA